MSNRRIIKFLSAFRRGEEDFFFGRDEETRALYELVSNSSLVLVHGNSGTGKTSLIQCGLSSMFDSADWLPIHIRRESNLQDAIVSSLDKYLERVEAQLAPEATIMDRIATISREYAREVYLIFDQFEELFILGNQEEQQAFFHQLRTILEHELRCHVLLVTREEYFVELHEFDSPRLALFDHRLRVRPMSVDQIRKVVAGTFAAANIKLEGDEDQLLDNIVEIVTKDQVSAQLAYLQVYMDALYQRCRTDEAQTGYAAIVSQEKLDQLDGLEEVFSSFINQATNKIQQQLQEKYDGKLPSTFTNVVLDAFVTEDGTRRPVQFKRNEQEHINASEQLTRHIHLTKYPNAALSDCIQHLEEYRILHTLNNNIVELAHDSVAAIIDQQRTLEARELNQISSEFRIAYQQYLQDPQKTTFLSPSQIAKVEPYLDQLLASDRVGEAEARFFDKSVQHRKKQERTRTRVYQLTIGILLLSLLASGLFEVNRQQKRAISEKEDEKVGSLIALHKRDSIRAEGLQRNGEFAETVALFEDNLMRIDTSAIETNNLSGPVREEYAGLRLVIESMNQRIARLEALDELDILALAKLEKSKGELGDQYLPNAYSYYKQAQALAPNNPYVNSQLSNLEERIENAIEQWKSFQVVHRESEVQGTRNPIEEIDATLHRLEAALDSSR